jgi:HAD superfamily hydrolase (TIGR01549 family)
VKLGAVLFDLGDVIMNEETEEKVDNITQRAELHPGMVEVVRRLHARGIPMGLVADTRDGTFRNVLGMHGLIDLFSVFAISDHLGVEKPDRKMFVHALEGLSIPEEEWSSVAMIGNNLARDIRGANALGLITIWLVWNTRYPLVSADKEETPDFQVSTAEDLERLPIALAEGHDPAGWAHPQPFSWGSREDPVD